jgi:hypothetical protein
MTKVISTTKASAQLDRLIRKANQEKTRYILSREGAAAGVLVGIQDYIRTFGPEPEVLRVIGERSTKRGTSKLTMGQIDREISAYRKEKRATNAKSRALHKCHCVCPPQSERP